MIIHDCEQRSEEWYEVRKGKMTASNAAAIAANGKGLETYIYSLMAERYSTGSEDGWIGTDMQRGIDLEDQARMTYEVMHDSVKQVGFIQYDQYTGCSPDAMLLNKNKGLEIKCVNDANYFRALMEGVKAIDPKYIWQCQMSMLLCDMSEWDIALYNPNFEKGLLVFTIEKDLAMQEKLLLGIEKGKKLIQSIEEKYGK